MGRRVIVWSRDVRKGTTHRFRKPKNHGKEVSSTVKIDRFSKDIIIDSLVNSFVISVTPLRHFEGGVLVGKAERPATNGGDIANENP